MKKIILSIAIATLTAWSVNAQQTATDGFLRTTSGWEFELRAGVNFIGGTAPMDMPVEIRSIDGYKPKYSGTFEGVATKWFGEEYGKPEWGISSGLSIQNRGMNTKSTVKNYHTIVSMDNSEIEGYWTGKVDTDYSSTLLSIPLLANYRFNNNWKVRGGLYLGYQLENKFSGSVYDGYLRHMTPTGQKMSIDEGQRSYYDFSKEMQRWQWGARIGGSWRAYKHFQVNADLNWGFTPLFKKDFNTITFKMYPIYLQAGFGYQF